MIDHSQSRPMMWFGFAVATLGFLVAQFGIVRFFNMRILEQYILSMTTSQSLDANTQIALGTGRMIAMVAFGVGVAVTIGGLAMIRSGRR